MSFPTQDRRVFGLADTRDRSCRRISDDRALMDAYRGGDVYHALALICGLTNDYDAKRWKRENPAMRQRMKSLQLAINYGIQCRHWQRV